MFQSVLRRWRANRFAALLDRVPHPEESTGHGPRHRPQSHSDEDPSTLAALARRLAEAQRDVDTQPDPQFRANLRENLMAAANRDEISAESEETGPGQARRRNP